QQKIIGAALIPDGVHADRVGHHDDALVLRRAAAAEHLVEHVGIGGVNRDDHIRLQALQQSAQINFQREKNAEVADKIGLAIEPAVDHAPDARSAVDHPHVEDARPIVYHPVGLGEKIVQLDVDAVGRDLAEAVADPARGAVMSFAVAGGEDEDVFQDSLGPASAKATARQAPAGLGGEFNGYLAPAK